MAVDIKVATQEINSWLDYKKVKAAPKETYKAQIDTLIQAVCDGELTINATTFELSQTLNCPVPELDLTVLKYVPRLTIGEMRKASVNVKPTDFDGKCIATIAAATGKAMSHLDKMDSSDYNTAQAIAVFFM